MLVKNYNLTKRITALALIADAGIFVFKIISWYIIVEKAKYQIKLICVLPRFVNKISLFFAKDLVPIVCYVLPMMV